MNPEGCGPVQPDVWFLYDQMLRSRLFEEAVAELWRQGYISGEMHLGVGEEGVVAGVVTQLEEGDSLALDHRGTPPLLMRGVDPVSLLREFVGRPDGLCGGMGGHMHLFSPEHLAASSGIVGASGPAAVGFALAAQFLRPGKVAVAFFGEGAMNQGMLLEAFNLAAVWRLPVLFVCKDEGWAVTTPSSSVTAGNLLARARILGMEAADVDGSDVEAVWHAARRALDQARGRQGPTFLQAHCVHPQGHLLGDALMRIARRPAQEMKPRAGPLAAALVKRGGVPFWKRVRGLASTLLLIRQATRDHSTRQHDPLIRARQRLISDRQRLAELEREVNQDTQRILERALASDA